MSASLKSLISQSDSKHKSSTRELQQNVKKLKDQMRLILQLLQQQTADAKSAEQVEK